MLIRVVTLANLINKINLILNCTLTMPYIVVLSYIPVLSLQNIKNWLYPAINYLDAPILIIMPIKLSAVQRDINIVALQVKGSQLVIKGTVLSIVITEQLKALLAKVVAIEITLYYSILLKRGIVVTDIQL